MMFDEGYKQLEYLHALTPGGGATGKAGSRSADGSSATAWGAKRMARAVKGDSAGGSLYPFGESCDHRHSNTRPPRNSQATVCCSNLYVKPNLS